jgi:hypothetical protein
VSIAGGGPAAGWYADPADASQERWWDGTQWSATTRPLVQAPVAQPPYSAPSYPPPSYQAQTYTAPTYSPTTATGQFGGAQSYSTPNTGSFAAITAYSPTTQTGQSGYSGQGQYSQAVASADTPSTGGGWSFSGDAFNTNTSWNQSTTQTDEAPSNAIAVVGFVLALLGGGLLSLILSIFGLRKARDFAAAGMWPRGRALAKWGIGLSIWTMVLSAGFLVFWGYLFTANPALLNQLTQSYSQDFQTTDGTGEFTTDTDTSVADPNEPSGPSDAGSVASTVSDQMTELNGVTPTSVQCTQQGTGPNGTEYLCAIAMPDGSLITTTYTDGTTVTSP